MSLPGWRTSESNSREPKGREVYREAYEAALGEIADLREQIGELRRLEDRLNYLVGMQPSLAILAGIEEPKIPDGTPQESNGPEDSEGEPNSGRNSLPFPTKARLWSQVMWVLWREGGPDRQDVKLEFIVGELMSRRDEPWDEQSDEYRSIYKSVARIVATNPDTIKKESRGKYRLTDEGMARIREWEKNPPALWD